MIIFWIFEPGNDVIIDEPGDITEEELIYPSYDPESKILSIQITNEKGESKVVTIKMIHDTSEKPFLGGHKIMPQDIEYHHAQTQTLFLTRTWSEKFKGTIISYCFKCFMPRLFQIMNFFYRITIKRSSN